MACILFNESGVEDRDAYSIRGMAGYSTISICRSSRLIYLMMAKWNALTKLIVTVLLGSEKLSTVITTTMRARRPDFAYCCFGDMPTTMIQDYFRV